MVIQSKTRTSINAKQWTREKLNVLWTINYIINYIIRSKAEDKGKKKNIFGMIHNIIDKNVHRSYGH